MLEVRINTLSFEAHVVAMLLDAVILYPMWLPCELIKENARTTDVYVPALRKQLTVKHWKLRRVVGDGEEA